MEAEADSGVGAVVPLFFPNCLHDGLGMIALLFAPQCYFVDEAWD